MLGISLGLEAYAYQVDNNWKKVLQEHGPKSICHFLRTSVDPDWDNKSTAEDGKKNNHDPKTDKSFFEKTITRGASAEERAALIIITFSMILLLFHLIVACISKNYAYRTKWVIHMYHIFNHEI